MSSLSRSTKNGKVYFKLQFSADKKRRTLYLGSIRESAANKVQNRIDDILLDVNLRNRLSKESQEWFLEADIGLAEKLESWGMLSTVPELWTQKLKLDRPELFQSDEITLQQFTDWYLQQRRSDCEESTIRKASASLNQLIEYCTEHESIATVEDITPELAFRFQLKRRETKAEATVGKDIKIAKTAFTFGVKAGKVTSNPFKELKPGSDVNLDGQHIVPVSDYEKLVEAINDPDWRVIIALARLGGLRCPSELTNLKWTDISWDAKTIRVTSPKTKRHGKAERVIPLFSRLDEALSDHWELTGSTSEYVITKEHLRRRGTSLSERFHRFRESAGIPHFPNPFRNMRLSAANDVSRLPGVTPKNLVDWFGHDMKTALKHYHRTTRQDIEQAVSVDPFRDSEIMRLSVSESDVKNDARTPKHDRAQRNMKSKSLGNHKETRGYLLKSDPYGTRTRVAGVKGRSPRPLDEGAVICVDHDLRWCLETLKKECSEKRPLKDRNKVTADCLERQ